MRFLPIPPQDIPRNRRTILLLLGGDLSRLGNGERNLPQAKAREGRASGRERVHAGMRASVKPFSFDGRARQSLRAVVVEPNASVPARRRARNCPPYLERQRRGSFVATIPNPRRNDIFCHAAPPQPNKLFAFASASSSLLTSLPPPRALSGLPPPLPPTMGAIC